MPPNGKFAQGLRGFPTPNSIPSDGGYIVFRIPADNEYAGLILGAAQALTYAYNWYQWGDLTPDEAADAFRVIVQNAPYELCGGTLPGNKKIIRITTSGDFEELGEDGNWHEPSGDYQPPAVPPRTGGTPPDQNCLAAANAVNALQILYEGLSDDWAEGVDTAQAITNFLLGLAAVIAAPFGLIGESIVIIAGLLFNILYESLEFIGADLWDENFTLAFKCILYGCATNTDGVVTFDFECVQQALAAETNPFDLTASQIRLFGQLMYIFNFIGKDGLNSAGATTAIEEASCDECDGWCIRNDCQDNSDGWSMQFGGVYSAGVGWTTTDVPYGGNFYRDMEIATIFSTPFDVRSIKMTFNYEKGTFDSNFLNAWVIWCGNGDYFTYELKYLAVDVFDGTDLTIQLNTAHTIDRVYLELVSSINTSTYNGSAVLKSVEIRGVGEKPVKDGWIDC